MFQSYFWIFLHYPTFSALELPLSDDLLGSFLPAFWQLIIPLWISTILANRGIWKDWVMLKDSQHQLYNIIYTILYIYNLL